MELVISHATTKPEEFLKENNEILQVIDRIGRLTRHKLTEKITVFTATFFDGSKEVFLNVYNDDYDGFLKDVEKTFTRLEF